jgi:Protein of unknown function (DUF3014)
MNDPLNTNADPARVAPDPDDGYEGFDRRDERTAAPPERRSRGPWLIALGVLALAALAWWMGRQQGAHAPAPMVSAPVAPAPAPAPPPPVAITAPAPAPPAAPAVQNPIDDAAKTAALPALDASDPTVRKALTDWLGDKTVNTLLRSDDFVRRVVVTVDNFGREHAAPRLWPLNPAPGKFIVARKGAGETAAPENAARYQAIVALATSMEPARAAATYRAHYPLFQQAYRELGYPTGYFNDRLVQVIDRLLATPEPAQPPAVRKVEIKGELAAASPTSNFYEFTDPALDGLAAGQKLLLRMGVDNERKVKAQLRAFRAAIVKGP